MFSACQKAPVAQKPATNRVTFMPKVIPLSDPEIANPWRTPLYAGSEEPPPGLPFSEHYQRWCWADVESGPGQYDFSKIDALMAAAKADGGKAGFRIMPVNTSGRSQSCLPAYIRNQISEPPDWNSPLYLRRVQALLTALGQKYDRDPRMGWFEIGPYGNWGEWNLSNLPRNPMSPENKQKLIKMSLAAFPHKYLLMLTDGYASDGGDYDALDYAMSLSPNIGIRSDCLGSSDFGGASQAMASVQDRWQQAPVVLEYCGGADFQLAYNQLTMYHATMLADGDGNLAAYSSYNSNDGQHLITNFKTAGYRFVLDSLAMPSHLAAGDRFTVVAQWSNVNVAPAYLPWNVMIQLRSSSGDIAWQAKSQVNLATFIPTNSGRSDTFTSITANFDFSHPFSSSSTDAPVSITDNFRLPRTFPSGTYSVAVQILDPENYYKPMQLAIGGQQSDGSYNLGTIAIGGSSLPASTVAAH